jgi:hypothetical protein
VWTDEIGSREKAKQWIAHLRDLGSYQVRIPRIQFSVSPLSPSTIQRACWASGYMGQVAARLKFV